IPETSDEAAMQPKKSNTFVVRENAAVANQVGVATGSQVSIKITPDDGDRTKRVTMGQIKELQRDESTDELATSERVVDIQEVRVSLAQDSLIDLVDGGVKLPDGVEQEFYVVEDR
ncbi:MAG: hypothetical protein ACQESH_09055, partial [Campylobacterota bacterium]